MVPGTGTLLKPIKVGAKVPKYLRMKMENGEKEVITVEEKEKVVIDEYGMLCQPAARWPGRQQGRRGRLGATQTPGHYQK